MKPNQNRKQILTVKEISNIVDKTKCVFKNKEIYITK